MEAAPASGTVTLAPGKNAGEVALIDKAAELGDIGELPVRVPQKFTAQLGRIWKCRAVARDYPSVVCGEIRTDL
jgi:hypothetical protein